MQHDQDIAIQITIKGVRLCITIEPDEPHPLPIIPVEIPTSQQATTVSVHHTPTTNERSTVQGHTKSAVRSKIQKVHKSAGDDIRTSLAVAPIAEETFIKGYRVKVKYDDNAASKQDVLKSIIQAGKKVQ